MVDLTVSDSLYKDVFTLLTRTQHNSTTLRFDFFLITGPIGKLGCPKLTLKEGEKRVAKVVEKLTENSIKPT